MTPLVTSTVITLEGGSPYPFKVTTRLSAEALIELDDALPLARSAKVSVLIVLGFNDSENVSTTTALVPIPVAPFCGVTIVITGAAVSVLVPVVNVLENELAAFPDRSSKPELTCTVTVALPGNGDSGVNVITVPVPSKP